MFDPHERVYSDVLFNGTTDTSAEARVRAITLDVLEFLEMRVRSLPRNPDLPLLDAIGNAAWVRGFSWCVAAGALDSGALDSDEDA